MRSKNFWISLGHALAGLIFLLKSQRNSKIHLAASIIVLAASVLLRITITNWIFIIIAISLVWIAEAFNTALESFFDLVQPEEHHLVKIGKDTSAAAVLLAALASVLIGLLVLGPPLLRFGISLFS
jgi:diacylglycerol kinase